MDAETIDGHIEDVRDEVVGWRRQLHQNPELSFQEEETSRFIYETLESFGDFEISRPTETSVVARLVGDEKGRTIAIRADIDALPLDEETDLEFASKNEGVAHSCGHDGHAAILLGTAKVLEEIKENIRGEVLFVFQHAEEEPPGGAEAIVEAGAVDGADAIIGLHLVALLEVGKVGSNHGPMTAAPDTFEIVVKGEGGHAGQPERVLDPVAVAAQVVTNLQYVISRSTNPTESAVLSIGRIHGGTMANVIPEEVELKGTVRTVNEQVRKGMPDSMERIIKGIVEAHQLSYSFEYHRGPDPVVNDQRVAAIIEETALEIFGEEVSVETIPPIMGGEDFSAYQRVGPTAFFLLGAGNEEKGITHPNHHPGFDIDEDALHNGVKMFVHATLRLLDVDEFAAGETRNG